MADFQPWTQEEINYLIQNHKTQSRKKIAETLGRSESAVRHKLREIRKGKVKAASTTIWTPGEVAFLIENYKNMTYAELAKALGRTVDAVRGQVEKLGLAKRERWSPQEEEYLRNKYYYGYSLKKIAKDLGRPLGAVEAKAKHLGLNRSVPEECLDCIELRGKKRKLCVVFTEFLAWGSPCPARKVTEVEVAVSC